jgi:hypothetical protein
MWTLPCLALFQSLRSTWLPTNEQGQRLLTWVKVMPVQLITFLLKKSDVLEGNPTNGHTQASEVLEE